jgi:hypothetical protein
MELVREVPSCCIRDTDPVNDYGWTLESKAYLCPMSISLDKLSYDSVSGIDYDGIKYVSNYLATDRPCRLALE